MINTHIGECAIHLERGRDIVFRPTFLRVAQLGSPKEILDIFTRAQIADDEGFQCAYRALCAFADDQDIDDAIGYFYPAYRDGRIKIKYKEGLCPKEDLHVIGCRLLVDAIIGRPSEKDKRKAKRERPADDFDPAEYVAIGDAHLGGRDWWNATMIQLQKALKALNPDKEDEDDGLMTKEEQQDLFETIDRIKREKAAKNV